MAEACPPALPAVRSRPMGSLAGPQNGQRAAHTAVQALLGRQAASLPTLQNDTRLLPRPPECCFQA